MSSYQMPGAKSDTRNIISNVPVVMKRPFPWGKRANEQPNRNKIISDKEKCHERNNRVMETRSLEAGG